MTTTALARSSEVPRKTASGYPWIGLGLLLVAIGVYAVLQMERAGPMVLLIAVPAFVVAGLACPDMRIPIAHCLGWPERLATDLLFSVEGVIVELWRRARPAPGNILTQPQQMDFGR